MVENRDGDVNYKVLAKIPNLEEVIFSGER